TASVSVNIGFPAFLDVTSTVWVVHDADADCIPITRDRTLICTIGLEHPVAIPKNPIGERKRDRFFGREVSIFVAINDPSTVEQALRTRRAGDRATKSDAMDADFMRAPHMGRFNKTGRI